MQFSYGFIDILKNSLFVYLPICFNCLYDKIRQTYYKFLYLYEEENVTNCVFSPKTHRHHRKFGDFGKAYNINVPYNTIYLSFIKDDSLKSLERKSF